MKSKQLVTSLLSMITIGLLSCSTPEMAKLSISGYDDKTKGNGDGIALKRVEIIPLESTTNSMLTTISKAVLLDSLVVVQENNRILSFDKNGHFRNQIGRLGHGNGEHVNAATFCIDSNDNVLIFDSYKSSILKYTLDGIFISETKFKNLNLDNIQNAELIGNDSIFYSRYIFNDSHVLYSVINIKRQKEDVVSETPIQTKNIKQFVGRHSFSVYENNIRFVMPFENLIYNFNHSSLFEISTKQNRLDNKELSEIDNYGMSTYLDQVKNHRFCGFTDIFETSNHIILACKDIIYAIIDKDTFTCKKYSYYINENNISIPLNKIISVKDNTLIGVIYSYEIKKKKKNCKNKEFVNKIKYVCKDDVEDMNPIIVLYTLK